MPNVYCNVYFLFCAVTRLIGFLLNCRPVKHQIKVQIFPCVLYSMQMLFVGLIIIVYVDILKVGSVDEAVW